MYYYAVSGEQRYKVQLLGQLCQRALQIRELKARASYTFLIFLCNEQSGCSKRDAIEYALNLHIFASRDTFLAFDGFPVLHDLACSAHLDLTKDVWMAANQLGVDVLENVANRKVSFLARNFRVQVNLQEQVA